MKLVRRGSDAGWHSRGLWSDPNFVRLWSAATVSTFGTLVTRTALPFVAIILLHATPLSIGLLSVAEFAPGFLVGLVAGVWVDRLPRRPIMIACDLGRAVLVLTIPLAAAAGQLTLAQLYLVAIAASVLTVFFDVAYRSYLPTLISQDALIEGNSKLSAAGSAAETLAFGSGGWLVQWFSAPTAMLVDALSFLWSAFWVFRITAPEQQGRTQNRPANMFQEIADGLRATWHDPILRAMTIASMLIAAGYRMVGTVFLLFVYGQLGFGPGLLGLVFAVGGLSSLLGAAAVGRITRLAGFGPAMILAIAFVALGQGMVTLASGASAVALLLLIGQQLVSDPAATVYDVVEVSLRQTLAPEALLGRINASVRVVEAGAMVIGSLLGSILGETIGLRLTILVGSVIIALTGLWLAATPLRHLREIDHSALDVSHGAL
jgi:MFS family permease